MTKYFQYFIWFSCKSWQLLNRFLWNNQLANYIFRGVYNLLPFLKEDSPWFSSAKSLGICLPVGSPMLLGTVLSHLVKESGTSISVLILNSMFLLWQPEFLSHWFIDPVMKCLIVLTLKEIHWSILLFQSLHILSSFTFFLAQNLFYLLF